jgi:hypothetical protein
MAVCIDEAGRGDNDLRDVSNAMSVEISSVAADRPKTDFDAIFKGLPPLDSSEYLVLLENASVRELPAQVLAMAFRQLIASGSAAADATLLRLVADKRFDYLLIVRKLGAGYTAKGNHAFDADDLVQETIKEIVRTLPTDRGAIAEGAWVFFIRQRFSDAWRNLYGRKGEKDPGNRVEEYVDERTGLTVDPVVETDGRSAEWHVQLRESKIPWLITFLRQAVENITDPLARYVAADQIGEDPSPISAGQSTGGKPPLTEQLGVDRFKVSRALKSAKKRLAAELLEQNEKDMDIEIDMEWLRRFAE